MRPQALSFPEKFTTLFAPRRYKVFYGGRGSSKSWSVARVLVILAHTQKHRIGCFRELMNTIADSVHRLLRDQIEAMGLLPWFDISQASIRSRVTGSEFLFKGLRHNAAEIKSTEGITIAWIEEAQLVGKDSWELLIPTVRVDGSEIWVTFNPIEESDPTYQRFVVNPPPEATVVKVGWQDNPWFPKTLDDERRYMLHADPEAYEHVWNGACRRTSESVIFKGRYAVETFEAPAGTRFYHGADFGFANDPTVLIRCYTTGRAPNEELWVDHESVGYAVEIDDTPELFDRIPTARQWPIHADSARPETISYLKRQGFNISPAEKWTGSVEDGIAHLKGFKKIHIHERCRNLQQEARLYSYKLDRVTKEVLPIIVDKHNHSWDGLRYSLDDFIRNRNVLEIWKRLAR